MLKVLLRRIVRSTPQVRKFTRSLRFLILSSATIAHYLFLVLVLFLVLFLGLFLELFLVLSILRVSITVLWLG